jgi:1-deoxy-D-xylulose-5-phosphate reductoisomerase
MGNDAGAVLNAADEIAVASFMAGDIPFGDITKLCADALTNCCANKCNTISDILAADLRSREYCQLQLS